MPRNTGEIDVWVQVCVRLSEPMPSTDAGGPPVVGYYRNLGLRMLGPQPKSYLERLIPDGAVDWEDSEVGEVDPMALDADVSRCVTAPDAEGVWYRSGRIYFSEEDRAGAA